MSQKELLRRLSSFEGVFCSGFFIPDGSVITALALLFEKVHFLNQLEYAIDFSKRYNILLNNPSIINDMRLTPTDESTTEDPLENLAESQKETVKAYLYLSDQFFMQNALLFPNVFNCSLLPNGEVLKVTLIKQGKAGEKNTYNVEKNPLVVCTDGYDELNKLIKSGKIPILTSCGQHMYSVKKDRLSAEQIAANLAINSIAMVLPTTKAANANDILEAREKLRDHLPPFWSSMLKLSVELTKQFQEVVSQKELQNEINHAVSTIVKPALIELVHKLEADRKQWFRKILSSTASGLRLLAGKPPTDLAGLVTSSLRVGADVSLDFAQQLRKVEAMKQESGLTYLIEMHNIMK